MKFSPMKKHLRGSAAVPPPGRPPAAIDALLTEEEVADILNVSTRALQDWRLKGKELPHIRIGRLVRYSPAAVRAFIESQTRVSTSDDGGAV